MNLDKPVAILVQKICAEWNRAERAIKISEQVLGEDPFPPIKELRYSGRRVVEALQAIEENKPQETVLELLQDAYFDCLRAKHDAIDVAVNEIAGRLRFAERDLSLRSVVKAFPKFPKLVELLSEIEKSIADSRQNRSSRDEVYNDIQENFDGIITLYDEFKSSEEVMLKIADSSSSDEVRSDFVGNLLAKTSFSVAVLVIIYSVLNVERVRATVLKIIDGVL